MTLEQIGKTLPARLILGAAGQLIRGITALSPNFPARLAKKMRALFSARLNSVLHEPLFVYSHVAAKPEVVPGYVFCNTVLPLKLKLNLGDYTQGSFYFNGLPDFFLQLIAFSDEHTLFFDLGSNMGIISAAMSKFIPQNNIVAVEAMPETYDRLKQVFSDNCPLASAYNVALSSKEGALHFHIPSSDSGSASASLSPHQLTSTRGAGVAITTKVVQAQTFDEFYFTLGKTKHFALLAKHAFKIDVEGHEAEVLRGMSGYFSIFKGDILIVVEVRPETSGKVHGLMEEYGFTCRQTEEDDKSASGLRDRIYFRPSLAGKETTNTGCLQSLPSISEEQ